MIQHQSSILSLPLIALIVARGRNGVIGVENDLPWRLRDDMRHFVETTRGKPVIMGRKTWESFPKRPLPGRANLVVSRNTDFDAPGAQVFPSLGTALAAGRAIAGRAALDEIMVIGGGMIYAAALPYAARIYLTEVEAEPEGETCFPELDPDAWTRRRVKSISADAQNDHAFHIDLLDRKMDASS